ncbi:MAG: ATP-binding protein [Candidatus Onthomonas sp.]
MPYDGAVIHSATEALNANAQRHRAEFEGRRREIYLRVPRLQTIDRQLSQTVRQAAQTALRKGVDPVPALEQAKRQNLSLQQQRKQLLVQHGYPQDALTYKPLCPFCNDRGWRGSEMCQCLKALCGKEQIKALSSMLNLGDQSFDTFDLDYYSPVYDPAIGSSPRSMMEIAQDVCFRFANKFGQGNPKNLFLTGAPGLGKTFLSAAIARVVSEKGHSVVYDSAVNVFNRFDAQKFGRDDQASQDIDRYLSCDLMILDDLGSEMNSPLVQSSLYQLINSRMLGDRRTVISSNLSLDDVSRRYSPQVYSRLSGEYFEVRFFGEDIRKQKKARIVR